MFNKHDISKDRFMLDGKFATKGYDWWWHSFTGINEETGEEKAFFIEYFTCNPGLGGKKPILGQDPANKAAKSLPTYLMVKAGCWGRDAKQIHRFFGWDNVKIDTGRAFSIEADDCYASEYLLKGSVNVSADDAAKHPEYMCDAGSMNWELAVDKKVAFNVGYGTSDALCAAKAFEMYWHAEGMKTAFEGKVVLDGVSYKVSPETCYGYADKNWGSNFTSPWVWLSSNDLTSRLSGKRLENSVFDIGGGRPKVYFVPIERKLLGAFWHEGKCFEYNFSKLWAPSATRFKCEETGDRIVWKVVQENSTSLMKTYVTCKKEDMLFINYESPDGEKRYKRLWNGGNGIGRIKLYKKVRGNGASAGKAASKYRLELIDDIDVGHIGCEYGEYSE
ncbi:MAG: hypothetical protein Q4E57_06835 [Eubacteriales bacterium]|nr:hypothetical protein [Eubacteriales bacterium]